MQQIKRNIKPEILLYGQDGGGKIITRHLVLMQTTKAIGRMAGTFSISMLPDQEEGSYFHSSKQLVPWVFRNIAPMDVIAIKFTSAKPYFMGIVDKVTLTKMMDANGTITRGVTILGRDGGKLLEMGVKLSDTETKKITDDVISLRPLMIKAGINPNAYKKITQLNSINKGIIYDDKFTNARLTDVVTGIILQDGILYFPARWDINKAKTWGDMFLSDDTHLYSQNYDGTFTLKYRMQPEALYEASSYKEGIRFIKQYPLQRFISRQLLTSAESIAQIIQGIGGGTFYETWVETGVVNGELKWILRFRPKPFDRLDDLLPIDFMISGGRDETPQMKTIEQMAQLNNKTAVEYADLTWDNLKTFINGKDYWTLDSNSLELSCGDDNVINIYVAKLQYLAGIIQELEVNPLMDVASILKYGNHRIEVNDVFQYVWEKDAALHQEYNALRTRIVRDRLYNWYWMNAIMMDGSATCPADDRIRIGDKVFISNADTPVGDTGIFAYVIAVGQRWDIMQQGSTQVRFDRGHNESMRKWWLDNFGNIDLIREQQRLAIKGMLVKPVAEFNEIAT